MSSSSPTDPMQWVSALSTRASLEAAVIEVVQRTQEKLDGTADLAMVFISSAFTSEYSRLMPLFAEHLGDVPLIGCSGGGVLGPFASGKVREVEDEAALSLTLMKLPGVTVQTFHLLADELPDLDSPPSSWSDLLQVDPSIQPKFVIMADSSSAKLNDLLQGLDFAYGGSVTVGGLASGNGGQIGLFRDGKLYREGTVGVALGGNIAIDTIVAQGCRPIGEPYRVTESERNIILSVEIPTTEKSARPLSVLRDAVQELDEEDRALAQQALFVGIAQSEFKLTLERGDFLIRNLLGVDPKEGAIAIGDRIRPGQRVQFHLRDAQASADDLEALLRQYQRSYQPGQGAVSPVGALLFSCMGRGEGLYGEADFDSGLFGQFVPYVPLSGFFCFGEIGPVGGSTFLHGYTSVFAIFRALPQTTP
jgi:small ligand-binding sensory domain FIST